MSLMSVTDTGRMVMTAAVNYKLACPGAMYASAAAILRFSFAMGAGSSLSSQLSAVSPTKYSLYVSSVVNNLFTP